MTFHRIELNVNNAQHNVTTDNNRNVKRMVAV
jgi:hypothetical protein